MDPATRSIWLQVLSEDEKSILMVASEDRRHRSHRLRNSATAAHQSSLALSLAENEVEFAIYMTDLHDLEARAPTPTQVAKWGLPRLNVLRLQDDTSNSFWLDLKCYSPAKHADRLHQSAHNNGLALGIVRPVPQANITQSHIQPFDVLKARVNIFGSPTPLVQPCGGAIAPDKPEQSPQESQAEDPVPASGNAGAEKRDNESGPDEADSNSADQPADEPLPYPTQATQPDVTAPIFALTSPGDSDVIMSEEDTAADTNEPEDTGAMPEQGSLEGKGKATVQPSPLVSQTPSDAAAKDEEEGAPPVKKRSYTPGENRFKWKGELKFRF